MAECHHHAAELFGDFKLNLGVVLQRFADADEAAAVLFDGGGQVKGFSHQFVAQAGAVAVGLDFGHAQAPVKDAGAEDADAVVEDFDLDVRAVFVVAVHHGVEQRLAQGGQRVAKALCAAHCTGDFKGHRHIRDDKAHGLVHGFKQGVGELAVVNDHARRFEATDVDVMTQRLFGKQQHGSPGGAALADVVEFVQCAQAVACAQSKPPARVDLLHELVDLEHGQVVQFGVVRRVGVPRELERLQVEVADLIGVEGLVGVGHALVVAPLGADGLDGKFGHADDDQGLAVHLVRFEFRDDGRAGGGLDLHQPFIEALFSQRNAWYGALVCHTHEHAAAFGVGKGHQRFDAGLVKRGFEFLRLCFTSFDPVL